MAKTIETTGKTVDEAVKAALIGLNAAEDEVDIEVLEEPTKGFLGIGGKEAKVRATLIETEPDEDNSEDSDISGDYEQETASDLQGQYDDEEGEEDYGEYEPAEEAACEYISSICEAMGIEVELEVGMKENCINIDIKGDNIGLLIGRRGETLNALQYMTSLVVNKDKEKYYKVNVDIENYRQKREEALENLAKNLADRVLRYRKPMTLEPMNPNERRVIHSVLQNVKGVETYSIGEEPNRRVVIKPVKQSGYGK